MISTVQNNSTSYEQTTTDNFHQLNHIEETRPNGFRRLSLRPLPSQSKLKTTSHRFIPNLDFKIICLCLLWYLTSILSNNSTKLILRQFKHPITLTECQFVISLGFCILTLFLLKLKPSMAKKFPQGTFPDSISIRKLVKPTSIIILSTLPMGGFQFIGHITSHKATSVIPVSLVHTIKLLSPITTVFIYKILFKKNFNFKTYLTLIPLIIGVMLSCLKTNSKTINYDENYEKGCLFAFLSMIIFVSQNIFAKKILSASSASTQRLPTTNMDTSNKIIIDKLTILYWCSAIGFCLTLPIYILSEFSSSTTTTTFSQINLKIFNLLLINGFSHFVQSLLAFQILGLISTINYSIVNILKRICVILASIMYEKQSLNGVQSIGLVLTMIGLYSYDKWGKC